MSEDWLPISGYEGLYEISDIGRVRSNISGGKILKPLKHTGGYRYVNLYKNKKQTKYYIHRLVAAHFIREPYRGEEVNHLNGIKEDNSLKNLEWTSPVENNRHARETGLINNSTEISQYTIGGKFLRNYESISKAAKETGLYYPAVKNAVFGYQKSSGGFLWRVSDGTKDNLRVVGGEVLGTKNNTKEIIKIDPNGEILDSYESIREASIKTGLGYSAISKCVTRVNKTCGGFTWKYRYEIDAEEAV